MVVLLIPCIGITQENIKNINLKDTVLIDSVAIINKQFSREFDKFYRRNEELIGIDSYFVVFISHYSEDNSITFLIDVSLRNDLDNYMQNVRENVSGYFIYKNNMVLIPVLYDETGLFIRTRKKQLVFNHKENIAFIRGLSFTHVGYKLRKTQSSKVKIKKKYYIKYPHSKLKSIYYRIRYMNRL
jgi:hypothetical protein